MNTILITGSLGGIGDALVKCLSKDFKLVLLDKKNRISKKKNIIYINSEVIKNNSYKQKLSNLKIISVVNTAAVLDKKKFKNVALQDIQEHFNNNVFPCFELVKNLEKNLIKNKSLFLNIGSIHTHLTKKDFLPYAVSKSALVGLTKSLAVEYMGNFSINILNLGPVNTPMLINNLNNKNIKSFIKSQPTKKIICPKQLSKFIKSLIINRDLSFTGSVINYDNGHNSLLKDE